jgi:hypothetical protein
MKKSDAGKSMQVNEKKAGLGLGMVAGAQDLTLSNQDAVVSVVAEPDLSDVHAAFQKASERVDNVAKYLDFSSDESARSSISTIMTIYDEARRTADLSLTRQFEHEDAQIDRRVASYLGELEKLNEELRLLEDELAAIA